MIDYDKLRVAHELVEKYRETNNHEISIEINFTSNLTEYLLHTDGQDSDAFSCVDNLIQKLQELTQSKAKYSKKDFIWVLDDSNRASHKKIIGHRWDEYEKEYVCELTDSTGEPYWITENSLYPTKSALIEAQIEYWVNQLKGIPEFSKLTGEYRLIAEPEDEIYPPTGIKYQFDPSFEGEVDGFSQQGYKIRLPIEGCCQACVPKLDECQHESDGKEYCPGLYERILAATELTSKDLLRFNKCLKCGEFYK